MPYTRITTLWTGPAGLPGYSRFRFSGALTGAECATAANRVRTWFSAMTAQFPTGVFINWDGVGQIYNDSQVQTGAVAYTPPTQTFGTGTGTYAAPAGAVVNWLTGVFVNGRQVTGRTFLVPLNGAAFQDNGTLASGTVSLTLSSAATLLGGTPALVVPSRRMVGGVETFGVATVTGASVPDKACILRSRRD